jgi:hypothetical protein
LTALPDVAYVRSDETNDRGASVSDSAWKSSTSLEQALGRLAAAVERLEQAMEVAGNGSNTEHGGELEAVQTERTQLREAQTVIAEQLDATIARLRGVLDG